MRNRYQARPRSNERIRIRDSLLSQSQLFYVSSISALQFRLYSGYFWLIRSLADLRKLAALSLAVLCLFYAHSLLFSGLAFGKIKERISKLRLSFSLFKRLTLINQYAVYSLNFLEFYLKSYELKFLKR